MNYPNVNLIASPKIYYREDHCLFKRGQKENIPEINSKNIKQKFTFNKQRRNSSPSTKEISEKQSSINESLRRLDSQITPLIERNKNRKKISCDLASNSLKKNKQNNNSENTENFWQQKFYEAESEIKLLKIGRNRFENALNEYENNLEILANENKKISTSIRENEQLKKKIEETNKINSFIEEKVIKLVNENEKLQRYISEQDSIINQKENQFENFKFSNNNNYPEKRDLEKKISVLIKKNEEFNEAFKQKVNFLKLLLFFLRI